MPEWLQVLLREPWRRESPGDGWAVPGGLPAAVRGGGVGGQGDGQEGQVPEGRPDALVFVRKTGQDVRIERRQRGESRKWFSSFF